MIRTFAPWVAAAIALCGCAEMSAGDCTDKGQCDWIDATDGPGPGPAGDANLDARSPPDPLRDAALDRFVGSDGGGDDASGGSDAVGGGGDATVDAGDATVDAGDATVDAGGAASDAPLSDAGDAPGDAQEAGDVPSCTCVPSAPSGWSGPIALAEATGAPPPAIAACAAPYETSVCEGNADPSAPAAQCGCTCGPAAGGECPAPRLELFSDSACSVSCGGATVAPGGCAPISTAACGAGVYARATAPTPAGGGCAPQPTRSVPPWGWGRAARACALPTPAEQGACGASLVCAPAPSPPFSGHLCVAIAGEQPCPAGSAYGVRHVYYGGATDGRDCSTCSCGDPDGGSCSGSFTTYNASACSLPTSTFPLAAACDAVQIATASLRSSVAGPSGGSCAPSAVQPVGALVPTQATTVCCVP